MNALAVRLKCWLPRFSVLSYPKAGKEAACFALIAAILSVSAAHAAADCDILSFPGNQKSGVVLIFEKSTDLSNYVTRSATGQVSIPHGRTAGVCFYEDGLTNFRALSKQNVSPIVKLDFRNSGLGDNDADCLAKFSNLIDLELYQADISDKGLLAIAHLNKLQTINISETKATGKSITIISKLPAIEVLAAGHIPIDDPCLEQLYKLPRLRQIALTAAGLDNDCLLQIAKCNIVTDLKLDRNPRITDEGIKHLVKMSRLKTLNLTETAVTPACVRYLAKIRKLSTLVISFPRWSPAAVSSLSTQLPQCKVINGLASDQYLQLYGPLHSPIAPQARP